MGRCRRWGTNELVDPGTGEGAALMSKRGSRRATAPGTDRQQKGGGAWCERREDDMGKEVRLSSGAHSTVASGVKIPLILHPFNPPTK